MSLLVLVTGILKVRVRTAAPRLALARVGSLGGERTSGAGTPLPGQPHRVHRAPQHTCPRVGPCLLPAAGAVWGAPCPREVTHQRGQRQGGGRMHPPHGAKQQGLAAWRSQLRVPPAFACRGPLGVSKPFFTASPFTRCQDGAARGREPSQAGQSSDEPQRRSSGMGGQDPQSPFPSAPRGR